MKQYIIFISIFSTLLLWIPNFSNKVFPPNPNDSINVVGKNNLIKFEGIEIDTNKAGTHYITNYKLNNIIEKQIWSIEQDIEGVMFFANQRGIITYNGSEWDFIKTPGVPYTIVRDTIINTIFVGCNNGIGYLEKNNGKYLYKRLFEENIDIDVISKISYNKEDVCFYGENIVIVLEKKNFIIKKKVKTSENKNFYGLLISNNSTYVKTGEDKIYNLSNDSVIKIAGFLPEAHILFSIKKNENEAIIGTSNDKMYIFDGEKLTDFKTDAEQYIEENYLMNAIDIGGDKMIISTFTGGVLVIDKQTGKTMEAINYFTGLPDNEVFSIGMDNNNGLWLSHTFGVSRVDFNIPVRNFSNYMGLEGKIISTEMLDSIVYVITTKGAYYLSKPKSKKEFEVVAEETEIKKQEENSNINNDVVDEIIDPIDEKNEIENDNNNDVNNNVEDTDKKKKNGVFKKLKNKLFNRKDRKNKNNKNENTNDNTNINGTDTEVVVPKTDTVAEIVVPEEINEVVMPENNNNYVVVPEGKDATPSVFLYNYYKKIDNLDLKCREIIRFNNELLISTNSGLYYIEETEAKPVIEGKFILKIHKSEQKNRLFVSSTSGLDMVTFDNKMKFVIKNIISSDTLNDNVFSIAEENKNTIWLGGEGYAYKVLLSNDSEPEITTYELNPDFLQKVIVKKFKESIYFFLLDGIYLYDNKTDKIVFENKFDETSLNSIYYIESQQNIIWYKETDQWKYMSNGIEISQNQLNYFNLFDNIKDIKIAKNGDAWIVDNYRNIYTVYNQTDNESLENNFVVYLEKIFLKDSEISSNNISINYKDNDGLKFKISSPAFLKENSTKYQYKIEGSMNSWSEWSNEQIIPAFLSNGKYTLLFKAKNILEQESAVKKIKFNIKPPFWKTTWFYILVGFSIFILILAIGFLILNSMRRRNKILEARVKERTSEIMQQKEEIVSQRDEIHKHLQISIQHKEEITVQRDEIQGHLQISMQHKEEITAQRDEIQQQHNVVVHQQQEILHSLNYARRIQSAVLPPTQIFNKYFNDFFIINMPRDIVSGDFYWLKEKGNQLVVTVADCTGHGVPGAFLSMMGTAFLSEIVTNNDELKANNILSSLRKNVINSLHVTEKSLNKDGMDISLCVFDFDTNIIQYAGAYNPLYIYRSKQLIEIAADKMPIGHHRKKDIDFVNHSIELKKDDVLYLFSDGYADQFGGEHGRKFRKVNYKKLLKTVSDKKMKEQQDILTTTYIDWKGDYDQIDDVLLMGLRI